MVRKEFLGETLNAPFCLQKSHSNRGGGWGVNRVQLLSDPRFKVLNFTHENKKSGL